MWDIRVLVVDDEEPARRTIRAELLAAKSASNDLDLIENIEFDEAVGPGEELSRLVRDNSYDLAVVDFRLIDGTGLDVIDMLAPYDPLLETKIIVCTGFTDHQGTENILRSFKLGAFSFVRKGEDGELREELVRALRALWVERNRALVGSFVDSGIRQKLADPGVMAKLREGCVVEKGFLFCDIAGSTPFIKKLQSGFGTQGKVGPVLRGIFSWITQVLQRHGGIIDKFIGDEVMAYFGDSVESRVTSEEAQRNLCSRMVEAAIEIRDGFAAYVLEVLRENRIFHRPKEMPSVKTVINFAPVLWGVLGSNQYMDLTIMTDGVIRTARVMQHREGDEKLVTGGDIWLMEGVFSCLAEKEFALEDPRKIMLKDFNDEIVRVRRVITRGVGDG